MKQGKVEISTNFLPVEVWLIFSRERHVAGRRRRKQIAQPDMVGRLDGQATFQTSNFSLGANDVKVRLVVLINAVLELGSGDGITRA